MDASLDVTWPLFLEPGMDDLAEGIDLDKMFDFGKDLKVFPFQFGKEDRLFLGRFEFPKYKQEFMFKDAFDVFKDNKPKDPAGFIDFLSGFPIDCTEMLVLIGQYSSKAKEGEDAKVNVLPGKGVTPPVPPKGDKGFFKWPEKDKILLNLTALATKGVAAILAPNLEGEPKPKKPHFWLRVAILPGTEDKPRKFPVPGEFVGLGVRLFPGSYWGHQLSSPFVFSGNWADSVYLSSAEIKEVIAPTDTVAYPTYTVTWHGKEIKDVKPSDFTDYRVGDRVTVLKDITTTKTSQTWKDPEFDKDKWCLAPISYFGGV